MALGIEDIGEALYMAGARDFFVATVDEGVTLGPMRRTHAFSSSPASGPAPSGASSKTTSCR